MHYCFQEKGSGALLFSGEGIWCTIVLSRRDLVHYCYQEKGTCTNMDTLLMRRCSNINLNIEKRLTQLF